VSKFCGVMAGFLLACLPAAAQQPTAAKRIYTHTNGQVCQADTGFNTGTASPNAAVTAGVSDPVLYQSNRYNPNTTPPTYSFARVFNVKLNNNLVSQNFDIFAAVGANTAVVEGFHTVANGAMAIEFDRLAQNPKINAIEILPVAGVPLLTMKFTYPDGTAVAGSLHYTISTSLLTPGRKRSTFGREGFL